MCGIVACLADGDAAPVLLEGLRKVEYRGYDSAGIATVAKGKLIVTKGIGKIADLERELKFEELPGAIGIAHCLHPDTLVQLSDGRVTPISQLSDISLLASVDMDSLQIVPALAKKFRHQSPPMLTRVRTDSSTLLCTDSHWMFVVRDGAVSECMVRDLRKGDLLIRPKSIAIEGRCAPMLPVTVKRYVRLGPRGRARITNKMTERRLTQRQLADLAGIKISYLGHVLRGERTVREDVISKLQDALSIELGDDSQPVSHSHGKYVNMPESTTPELIELVAYVLGDGAIYDRMIRIKEADFQLISHYAGRFREIFGISPVIKKLRGANAYVLVASSTSTARWFALNFTRDNAEFLSSIGSLTTSEVGAFIRGIFDAEGTVNLKSKQVLIRMTDEKMTRTLQFLLLRFGIQSSFGVLRGRNKNWKTAYSISISSQQGVSKFLEAIGTSSKAKRRKLVQLSRTMAGRTFNAIDIPVRKDALRQPSVGFGIGTHLKGAGFLDRPTVGKILTKITSLTNYGETQLGTLLTRYTEGEVLFERVTSITREPTDVPYLYDLEVEGTRSFVANCLVSHNSRWATHGGVTRSNAHPHTSCNETIAIVHNGIIKNHLSLRDQLERRGHLFKSETDSEVIAHVLEEEYRIAKNPTRATAATAKKLEGQYAFVALFQDKEDMLTGARNDAPLLVGVSEGKKFLASDVLAFIEHTDRVIFLDNKEVVTLSDRGVRITDLAGREIKKEITRIAWELADASKLDYAHYTLKEIEEQPSTVQRALLQEAGLEEFVESIRGARSLFLTGAGSSFHASLILKHRLGREARIRAEAVVAGEFENQAHFVDSNSVLLAISQSGETADVLEAVKLARARGAKILSIVNAAGSSLTSASDCVLQLNCGPEVGVAATKSFTSQLVIAGMIVERLTARGPPLEGVQLEKLLRGALATADKARALARKYSEKSDFYFVGRGVNYPIALEGALKLKELSYIHAEGMPASELKHGTLALIEAGTPVIVLNPSDETYEDTLSNAHELRARGAEVIGISDRQNEVYSEVVPVPPAVSSVMPMLEVVPLQLLAYHMALERENNPDYPRNLAKSVTVK